MPQERLSSLGDTTTLGPEWLQRGIRTSPKSGEQRDGRDGLTPPAASYRYGRDQLLLLQSSMELPSPPRMSNGRPKAAGELNALQQKFPVFGAMTKEHLVSEGVLPASTLEDKQVAGTLRGRAEGRGRGNKGRGKGGAEEASLQASPVQTTPGGSAVGSMMPLELPERQERQDRQVSGGGELLPDEKAAGPRNPMSSFLARVLTKGPAPEQKAAESAVAGLPPGTSLPPPAAAVPPEPPEVQSPTLRPPVPEKPPPPPPGPGEAAETAPPPQEVPVRPGPLPSSPPRHPPSIGLSALEQSLPEPIPSPQRAPVNLAMALAGASAASAQALERELGLGLGESLMPPAPQPQALQPGRVTAPQRQAPLRMEDQSVTARLQEDLEEFENGSCWYYKDPSGKVQGPFSTQQMRNWHQVGYFKNELPIRFKDGSFYRLDHLYPEAPFQNLPHTVDPRAQAAQAVAQAQAQAQQVAQQHAAAQAQMQAQALARQRALLADPTLASSGFEYMRLQQAAAQANAHAQTQAQIATMKSMMGLPPFGAYDDRRWPEELKALGIPGPSASAATVAAANAVKEQQRLEQQRLEREKRLEEQRVRQQLAQQVQAAQAQAAQAAAAQQAAPAKPPPMVPPVPAPTMSPMEAAKEERKKPVQPKKPTVKNDAPGPMQVAPGPVPKEAPPLIASSTEFPTLGGGSEEHVVMAPAESSAGGFWERPMRPVKVGGDPPIAPGRSTDPKAKAAQKQQQKAKDEEKSELRRAQVKELLTEYGITLEEPMVNFVMSVNGSSEVADYLEALKVTDAENARRFGEAFLAKGLVEKVEKTKEAPPKRKHRIKGKEVDPSMLGFTAVPRGHYES